MNILFAGTRGQLRLGKTRQGTNTFENTGQMNRLTSSRKKFTINPIEGDKEFQLEIQPHLNAGLWPVYLEMAEMQWNEPPTDGREEAPGGPTPNTPVPQP